MPTPKAPFNSIRKPTDAQLADALRPHPFKSCPNCGRPAVSSERYCRECSRLVEEGFGVTPRAPHPTVRDTQQPQSSNAFDHKGYSDSISSAKIDPTRERY
jgi:hypothetical protein